MELVQVIGAGEKINMKGKIGVRKDDVYIYENIKSGGEKKNSYRCRYKV